MLRSNLLCLIAACLINSTTVWADDFVEVWFLPGLDRTNHKVVKVRVTDFSMDEEKNTAQMVYELISELESLPSSYLPPPDIPHIRVIASHAGDRKVSMFRVDKPVDLEDVYVQKWLDVYNAAWRPVEGLLGSSPLTNCLTQTPAAPAPVN